MGIKIATQFEFLNAFTNQTIINYVKGFSIKDNKNASVYFLVLIVINFYLSNRK